MSTQPVLSRPRSFCDVFERKDGEQQTTHYCPGCGHGIVHKYLAEAIDRLGIQDRTVFVNSVGCSVFAYWYFDIGHIQVPHGRCPAAATGVKRALPDSVVIGYQGDGDLAAIGANEILQAANRGENITIFFVNNAIYGMTGGQLAPTSWLGMETTTTPLGRSSVNDGYPMRVCELLAQLVAPFYLERVAIGDAKHNNRARKAIRKALENQIENRGFSLVEILSPCPTGWKLTPVDSAALVLEKMTEIFPLGVYRDGHEFELGHPRNREAVSADEVSERLELEESDEETDLPDRGTEMQERRLKISGFGGQGVLKLGTTLARAGMLAGREVTWMPSYGPQMRGGTAYCDVAVSGEPIGSPLVDRPDILVAMNRPSLEKFGPTVGQRGMVLYNSSMIDETPGLPGVTLVPVDATGIADRLGNVKVANMVMLGALVTAARIVSMEAVRHAVGSGALARAGLAELNFAALEAGADAVASLATGC